MFACSGSRVQETIKSKIGCKVKFAIHSSWPFCRLRSDSIDESGGLIDFSALPRSDVAEARQYEKKNKVHGWGGADNLLSATPQGTGQMKRTSCSLEGKYESERKF